VAINNAPPAAGTYYRGTTSAALTLSCTGYATVADNACEDGHTIVWTSTPATVEFSDAAGFTTTWRPLAAGTYTIHVTVDGVANSPSDPSVTVTDPTVATVAIVVASGTSSAQIGVPTPKWVLACTYVEAAAGSDDCTGAPAILWSTNGGTPTFSPANTNAAPTISFAALGTFQVSVAIGAVSGSNALRSVTVVEASASPTSYSAIPSLANSWRATLIKNDPSQNLQWTPSSAVPDFGATSPYNFVDPAHPQSPTARPTAKVPLYWGNSYDVRIGLVNTDGNYCGSKGRWPTGSNSNPVSPNPFNSFGCIAFLEAEDTWVFPVPRQSIPAPGTNGGYATLAGQGSGAANPFLTTGPLVFSAAGVVNAPLTFVGLPRPANWSLSCVQGPPLTFPCGFRTAAGVDIIVPRYNPDPQVWHVSASGVQQARTTAIGAAVVPNTQASPPTFLSTNTEKTNEFFVLLDWPVAPAATPATPTSPAYPQILDAVPTCAPSSGQAFVGLSSVGTGITGINFFPTCTQGLTTTACTTFATDTNCADKSDTGNVALSGGKTVANNLGPDVDSVWISQRPIQVYSEGFSSVNTSVLNHGDGNAQAVPLTFEYQQGSLPIRFSLPQDAAQLGISGYTIADNYWNRGPNTTSGIITITPVQAVQCATADCLTTTSPQNFVTRPIGEFFSGTVPTIQLSSAAPTGTLILDKLPTPDAGSKWLIFFTVTDGSANAVYYSVPYLQISLTPIAVTFPNLPPTGLVMYVSPSLATAEHYQVRIERSPSSLNLPSVTVNITIPAGLQFIDPATGSSLTTFVFTGDQTVIDFVIFASQAGGPYTVTFGGPSFLAITPITFTVSVLQNPITIKTLSTAAEGPYAAEQFWFEMTFSPPAPATFTITATSGVIGNTSIVVPAGSSGVVLGPVEATEPINVGLAAASYNIPVSFSLSGSSASLYSVAPSVLVTVWRRTFVVLNATSASKYNAGSLTVYSSGQRSPSYCIGFNIPLSNPSALIGPNDNVTITFTASSGAVVPGIVFSPASVVLSQSKAFDCVSISADRNWNWEAFPPPVTYTVSAYLGGSLANLFQNPFAAGVTATNQIWDFPHTVTVVKPKLTVELDPSSLITDAGVYALGETVQLRVYTDVLPAQGLQYQLVARGVSVTKSQSGSSSVTSHGTLAPNAADAPGQWQAWDVTFTGYAGDIDTAGTFQRQVDFNIFLSSNDAEFYRAGAPSPFGGPVAAGNVVASATTTVSVVRRGVEIVLLPESIEVGYAATAVVRLVHPVASNLTVSLSTTGAEIGAASRGLLLNQTKFDFLPNGPTSFAFDVVGHLLGTYNLHASLSGGDWAWFELTDASSGVTPVTVTKRSAIAVDDSKAIGTAASGLLYYAAFADGKVYPLDANFQKTGNGMTIDFLESIFSAGDANFAFVSRTSLPLQKLDLQTGKAVDFVSLGLCQDGLTYSAVTGLVYGVISSGADAGTLCWVDSAGTVSLSADTSVTADALAASEDGTKVYGVTGGGSNLYSYDVATDTWSAAIGATGWSGSAVYLSAVPGTNNLALSLRSGSCNYFLTIDRRIALQSSDNLAYCGTAITGVALSTGSAASLTAGQSYSPITVTIDDPILSGETVVITPSGSDFVFVPRSVQLVPGQTSAVFSYFLLPSGQPTARVFWTLSGADAWRYESTLITKDYSVDHVAGASAVTLSLLTGATNQVAVGVTREGFASLPFPGDVTLTPVVTSADVTFNPPTWDFTSSGSKTVHFTYTVNSVQQFNSSDLVAPTSAAIPIVVIVSGSDKDLYSSVTVTITVRRPQFLVDTLYSDGLTNLRNPRHEPSAIAKLFVVGKWSPWYSVALSSPPAQTVSLTITDNLQTLEFQLLSGGDARDFDNSHDKEAVQSGTPSVTLSFSTNSLVQKFRFRFVKLLSSDNILSQLSISTSSAVYDTSVVEGALAGLRSIPALAFSPIPAVYTDGASQWLFVSLADIFGNGAWPYGDAQFTLHILPPAALRDSVVVEPSTLEFSKNSISDLLQQFRIVHTNPSIFGSTTSYALQWLVRFSGRNTAISDTLDITSVVPQDAKRVLLSRYQIIPTFPHVLSYGWQRASFNLSHIPVAHISLTPRMPYLDGSAPARHEFGAMTPGGRVEFDPAVIVAAPGQQVVEFRVKAQPGVDRDALYYRVDWQVVGDDDDLVNYVDYLNNQDHGDFAGDITFVTWHIAPASAMSISIGVLLLCSLAVLLM